eukprot:Opistho-2@69366
MASDHSDADTLPERVGPYDIVQVVSIVLDSRYAWYLVSRDIAGSREQCFIDSLKGIMLDFDAQVKQIQIKHMYTLDGKPIDKNRYFSTGGKKERSHKMHAWACTAYALFAGLIRRKDPEFFRTPFYQRCMSALGRVAVSALESERRFVAQRKALAPPPDPEQVRPAAPLGRAPTRSGVELQPSDDIDAAIDAAMQELASSGTLKRGADGGSDQTAKRARVQ